MCYIALVKNTGGNGERLKNTIADKLTYNNDGAFVSSLGIEGLRTLDNAVAGQAVLDMPLDNLLVHFRMATTGAVTVGNVQGWELNGWVCVHNGIVSKLSGGIKEQDSDSLKFFRHLTRQLPQGRDLNKYKRTIRKVSYKYHFDGRAIIYNPVLDIALLFGDWNLYEYGGAIVFSSSYLFGLGEKIVKEHNGFLFEYDEGVPTGESKIDGIYIMDFAKTANWTLDKIGEMRENKSEYQGYKYTPYKPATPSTVLRPINVPEPEPEPVQQHLNIKLGLISPISEGEVVGFDLGGNSIALFEDELHTINGSCCMAGKCVELWDYLDKNTADNLIRAGVVYKKEINPFYI